MSDACNFGGPKPTIVGPRPDDDAGLSRDVPRGMERLLTLAGLSGEWREKVLENPLDAADDAGIELSMSEQAILKSVPKAALSTMADSFARKSGRPVLARVASGVAAAALLAANLSGYAADSAGGKGGHRADVPPPPATGSWEATPPAAGGVRADEPMPKTRGIQSDIPLPRPGPDVAPPDVPAPTPEVPPLVWQDNLASALAQARAGNQAAMAIFLHPDPPRPSPGRTEATDGDRPDIPEVPIELQSQKAILADSQEFRAAVRDASVLAVKILKPVPPPSKAEPEMPAGAEKDRRRASAEFTPARRYEAERKAYEAALKKYGVADTLPAVIFLAPDGSELSKLVQPTEEAKIVEGLKGVPPKLAAWITNQRPRDDRNFRATPGIPGS